LIKADCEGEPGPDKYNRTELQGANAMADVLGPVGAIAIWRAFAHPPRGEDQALQVLPPALFVVLSALPVPSAVSIGLSPH
jgi:hypothetical protein